MLIAIQGYVHPHYHSVYTAYLLITYTLSECTVTCQGDALSLLWWTKSNCSKDQWDWEIIDYYVALPLQQWVSVLFLSRLSTKRFWTLLGYTVTKACTIPRNLTWSTRPFLLVRGWSLGHARLFSYLADNHNLHALKSFTC